MGIIFDALNSGSTLTDTNISYYFSNGYSAWNAYEIAQFEQALQQWENVANVTFTAAGSAGAADFVINNVSASVMQSLTGATGVLGLFTLPNGGQQNGYFNYQATGWDWRDTTGGLEQGGYGFLTILHEVGHGLGLAHPHDGTVLPGVTSSSSLGTNNLNQGINTVMTYNDGLVSDNLSPSASPGLGWTGSPMAFDIHAIQQLYGTNETYHSGGNNYILPFGNSIGTFYTSIWDTGGSDRIVHLGSQSSVLNLQAASLDETSPNAGGVVSTAAGIFGGYTIANGVNIENAEGGSGADQITGNSLNNVLVGNDGNDNIVAGAGDDLLNGGAGNDILDGGAGSNAFLYLDGDNFGSDTIHNFSPSSDVIVIGGYAGAVQFSDLTITQSGNDAIVSVSGGGQITLTNTVIGDLTDAEFTFSDIVDSTAGKDNLTGTSNEDIIDGLGGNDILVGLGGGDILYGNDGFDWLYGGAGDDWIYGGAGTTDVLLGDAGNDHLFGGDGFDYIYGYADNDIIEGGNGIDVVYGGTGDDIIYGQSDTDWLFGGAGNDILFGGDTADLLIGEAGDDIINAGAGNDWIWGDAITAAGGGGADIFTFTGNWGVDTIYDFENGIDMIDLSGTAVNSFSDLTIGQIQGGFTWIVGGGNYIYLNQAVGQTLDASDLTAEDFIF